MIQPEAPYWLMLCSAIASAIFLTLVPYNLGRLYSSPVKVYLSWHGKAKAIVCVFYATLQLALLVKQVSDSPSTHEIIVSSLDLAASLGVAWLSSWAHRRSIRPSNLAVAYLLAKLVCYLVWILVSHSLHDRTLVAARVCSTLIVLVSESQGKRSTLFKAYAGEPPEVTSSFLGNVLFLWINPILSRGYRNPLSEVGIPDLDHDASSKALRRAILRAWDQRGKPENITTLPRILLRCLMAPFLSAILPRISVIAFRFAQPLLISVAIRFVTASSAEDNDPHRGYWIIVAAATTYIGMAISNSAYQHRIDRLEIMTRGALISLLHEHALEARGVDEGEDQGRVVTLMSNDVSNIESAGNMAHETWAQFVEVLIGTFLLSREVGWLWPVPIVFIFVCSRVSRHVAKHLKAKQGSWNTATQQRISATSSMLGAMKNIKMLGMEQAVADHIEDLRQQEMNAAGGVRWLMLGYNASANALGLFAPVITIVLYAVLATLHGGSLDVETAFTTIALLSMITHPANMIMTIVPRAVVSLSSFERIQAYLLSGSPSPNAPVLLSNSQGNIPDGSHEPAIAIAFENVTIAVSDPASSTTNTSNSNTRPILQNINLEIPQGSLTIITGPVGAGKTTLARAILGDAPGVTHGTIRVSSQHVAYCAQNPWLPNQPIRNIILGPNGTYTDTESDQAQWWRHDYDEALRASSLTPDLATLPAGDLTPAGTRGANLSGGQRQRVALARAILHALRGLQSSSSSRSSMVLLDDSLSALDAPTQDRVVDALFLRSGQHHDHPPGRGLLRQQRHQHQQATCTVVWITTAARHFHLADDVVVLGADGAVHARGPWAELLLRRKDDPLLDEIVEHHLQHHHHHHHHQGSSSASSSPSDQQQSAPDDETPGGTNPLDRSAAIVTTTKDLDGPPSPENNDGDLSLYTYYARASLLRNMFLMAACTGLYGVFNNLAPYWLKLWTEQGQGQGRQGPGPDTLLLFTTGYAALLLLAWAATCGGMYTASLRVAPRSGLVLHHRLLRAVASAPLLFFSSSSRTGDATDAGAGALLNRFSADLQLVDRQLPPAALSLAAQTGKLLMQTAILLLVTTFPHSTTITGSAPAPVLLLALGPAALVVYALQRVYLRTSRVLRHLELSARATAVTSLLDAVAGAPTTRALGWRPPLALDPSQRALYLLLCLQRWLGAALDLLVAAVAVGTIALFVFAADDGSQSPSSSASASAGGRLGVALNVILVASTTLFRLVESWTGLEISLGAVARLRDIVERLHPAVHDEGDAVPTATREEPPVLAPPADWPAHGAIDITSLTAGYDDRHHHHHPDRSPAPALHEIDLHIPAGQTLVVCGRTGSGKSTLLLALLGLLPPDASASSGRITIDGVDMTQLSQSILRTRAFITVAQDAFFLPGASLHFNLDPEGARHGFGAPMRVIVSILVRTGLWGHFCRRRGDDDDDDNDDDDNDNYDANDRDGMVMDSEKEEEERAQTILATPLSSLPTLSTGQAQLLALARALIRRHVLCNPHPDPSARYFDDDGCRPSSMLSKPILLLDEVTSSLDPETEARMYDIIQAEFIDQGHTVVMVTHKLAGFKRRLRRGRDAVVWMANGRIERREIVGTAETMAEVETLL